MSVASFLAPVILLLSGGPDQRADEPADLGGDFIVVVGPVVPYAFSAQPLDSESAWQVRIEQRTTIRVSPRPLPMQPNMFDSLPRRAVGPRFAERKIGKCLPASGIAGVQVQPDNRLLLFLRDRRMVSASLERACSARDFYSGFYVAPNADGQLCVDRDTLMSRNGNNCKLSRIRQLVEIDE